MESQNPPSAKDQPQHPSEVIPFAEPPTPPGLLEPLPESGHAAAADESLPAPAVEGQSPSTTVFADSGEVSEHRQHGMEARANQFSGADVHPEEMVTPQPTEIEETYAVAPVPPEPVLDTPEPVYDTPIPPASPISPATPGLPARPGTFDRDALLWLLLITIAGGLFRFLWIDKPGCWTDEAYTFRRVVASFQDLLDVLKNDGFGPLLYEFNWWLAQRLGGASHLTPFWLRLLPAIAGTLMIPAMYFLARQLVCKRTSLVVALFTASSAYMMVYSHDAKMYMLLWLAVALNLGGLFWWFRTNLRVAWLSWIAAGILVGGTHAPGLIVLALQPIFLLTQRQMHWRKFLAFLAGMAVIASAPFVHYTQFNRFVDRVDDEGWSASGVGWVPGVLRDRGGEELALSAASAYMYSWEWPRFSYRDDDSANRFQRNREAAGEMMLQGFNINPQIMSGLMTGVWGVVGLCILGALPWTRRLRGVRVGEEPVQPAWRLVFWLGLWVLLPAYVYYCISLFGMKGVGANKTMPFVSPWFYWDSIVAIFAGKWAMVSLIAGTLCAGLIWSGRVFRIIAASLAGILALGLLVFFAMALWKTGWTRPVGLPDGKPGTEWIEAWRAIRLVGVAFYDAVTRPWMTWALAVILPGIALQLCADTVVDRLKKTVQLTAAVAGIFGALWLAHHFVSQELAGKTTQELGPIWMPRYLGAIWPAFAVAICALLMRLPTRIVRVVAVCVLIGVNVGQACGRMFGGTEPPVDRMIAEVYASQEHGVKGGPKVRSNFRTYIERPTITGISHPGKTWVDPVGPNPASKYYAALIRGEAFAPQEWRNVPLAKYVTILSDTTPRSIAADLKRNPNLDHITVWDRFPELPVDPKTQIEGYTKALNSAKAGIDYTYEGRKYTSASVSELERTIEALKLKAAGTPEPDPLLELLGSDWKRRPDQWFQVRYHWNWSEIYATRRREYVRAPLPPAPPAPAPIPTPVPTRPEGITPPAPRPPVAPPTTRSRSIFDFGE